MWKTLNGDRRVSSSAAARESEHKSPKIILKLTPDDSHVQKTGEIKDFVVIEEGGIAKGIRRVVAVTGEEAVAATLRMQGLEKRLQDAKRLSDVKEKDATVKAIKRVCELTMLHPGGRANFNCRTWIKWTSRPSERQT